MTDDLSEEAKLILAFIREQPGCQSHQLRNELNLELGRFSNALIELLKKKLIVLGEHSAKTVYRIGDPQTWHTTD